MKEFDVGAMSADEIRNDLTLYATNIGEGIEILLYPDNCKAENDGLLFSDVVRCCINGDISYEDAQRWCKKNRIPKRRLDDGLLVGLLRSSKGTKKRPTLQDVLFKIVDFLNEIIGRILEDFDE